MLGVDLDFLEPAVAARAEAAAFDTLGPNDCSRIGQLPKRLLLYLAAPGLIVPGKAFGGYELFSTTCQTVLFGTHPKTGQPYYWPGRSPEDSSPDDLPVVGQEALNALIRALEPLCGRLGPKHRQPVASPAHGRVAEWLQAFNDIDGKPVDLCRAAVEAAPEGDRYPTAFSAVVALVRIGLSDAEIITNVILPYLERFDRRERPDRRTAIMSGLRWARREIGPDAASHRGEHQKQRYVCALESPLAAPHVNGNFDLIVGFDTEYVRGSELDDSVPDDDNAVVSYQVALYAPATGQRRSGLFLTEGLTRRHRYSMRGYLNRALAAALDAGMVDPEGEINIALVAHFTRADLPGFRDFNRLKTRFDAVRKTYCSIKRPTICDLRTPSGVRVKARITLFDTRLLAPAGAGSLGALGVHPGLRQAVGAGCR